MSAPESPLNLNDILMDVAYHRLFQSKFPTEHFYQALSPHPTKENQALTEAELPIVKEALSATQEAKERKQIPTESYNPWGENLQQATLYVLSDAHQPGSNPEKSVFYTSKVFKTLESLNPQSLKYKLKSIFSGLRGKYGEDWLLEARPSLHVDALRVTLKSILSRAKTHLAADQARPSTEADQSVQAIVDLGDRDNPESTMGDVAFTALEFAHTLEEAPELKVAMVAGNHDADINNHGFMQEIFQRELFEQPVILQYVGDYALLTLNTNLWSHFWRTDFNQEKARFEELKKQQAANATEGTPRGKRTNPTPDRDVRVFLYQD